jgi:predicted DNA-binding protein
MNQKTINGGVMNGEDKIHKVTGSSSSPIRLQKQAKEKLDSLLTRANKNRIGKKIRASDLIGFSLDLLTEEYLKDLVARRLTNKERLEILYKQLSKTKRGFSREEFLGMLLDGKVAS